MFKEQKDMQGGKFSLTVFSLAGNEVKVDVQSDFKIWQLKDVAIKKLELTGSSAGGFNVIKMCNGCKKLSNSQTIKSEGLIANDSVMLYPIKSHSNIATEHTPSVEAPTLSQIQKATANLTTRDKVKLATANVSSSTASAPLEQIFRKILLTLLDLSYQLMFFDEEAEEIFQKKFDVEVDPDLITQLTSMGFSEKRAREALILNDMNVESSMEWMLKHGEDMTESDADEEEMGAVAQTPSVADISNRLNRWKKRSSTTKTNSIHVTSLMEMGFSKEECIEALSYNGNNLQSACNWLLGDRAIPEEDPNDTLDPESDLYKAIVNNPTIHVGLHNKRVLEALEDMLENPQRRHNWANDPTVGSVILHILKLYHKYSTAVS